MIAAFALVDEPELGILGEQRGVDSAHLTKLRADGGDRADIEDPQEDHYRKSDRTGVTIAAGDTVGLPACLPPAR